MRVRLVRRPGQPGTKEYVEQHGDRLICVRYRYDEATKRRYKTIEIIVDEQPWEPREREGKKKKEKAVERKSQIGLHTPVGIHVGADEKELISRLQQIHGWWIPKLRVWRLLQGQAIALGLADRIVGTIDDLTKDSKRPL